MIRVAFFDINDTLINHSHAQESAIKQMSLLLPKQNKKEFTNIWKKIAKKYWKSFEGGKISFERQRLKRIESIWNHFDIRLTPEQIKQYANLYVNYYNQALRLNPLLKIILELLQISDIPIGIISNGYGPQQRSRLKASGVESYFTKKLIFISGEIDIVKPDESIFLLAERAVKATASEIIFFGNDLENDIAPAQKRGWRTVSLEAF